MNQLKLSSTQINLLKWLAIVSMIVDHFYKINMETGTSFLNDNYLLYTIGRIAYPSFVIVLIYNFIHNTRSRSGYIKRIIIFSLISQPFFMYAFQTFYLNIFFSFSCVLIAIVLIESIKEEKVLLIILLLFCLLMIVATISYFTDYSIFGFLFSMVIYLFIKSMKIYLLVLSIIFLYISNNIANIEHFILGQIQLDYFIIDSRKIITSLIIVYILIYILKNINLNFKIKINKFIYYVFYPLHLFLIKIFS